MYLSEVGRRVFKVLWDARYDRSVKVYTVFWQKNLFELTGALDPKNIVGMSFLFWQWLGVTRAKPGRHKFCCIDPVQPLKTSNSDFSVSNTFSKQLRTA